MTSPFAPDFDQIVLTRLRVAAQQELPRYVAQMAKVESIADMMGDGLVLQMRSEVLALRHDCQHATGALTVEFEMPATWWQHAKQQYAERWWLRWLVKRRPVRTVTRSRTGYASFDIERYRTFPDAAIPMPDTLGDPVRILVPGPMRWRFDDERR